MARKFSARRNVALKTFATMVLLACMDAQAIDMTKPACVSVVVSDTEGQPISGAKISIARDGDEALNWQTDAAGKTELKLTRPAKAAAIVWTYTIRVQMAGYLDGGAWVHLFPGAEIALNIKLARKIVTRFSFVGPAGEPLANLNIGLDSEEYREKVRTDARGEFTWEHPALKTDLEVSIDDRCKRHLPIGSEDVKIVLTKEEMSASLLDRDLQLTVLQSDGTPGAGWYAGTAYSEIDRPSLGWIMRSYYADAVTQCSAEGRVALLQRTDTVALISPQGIPFFYTVTPENWLSGKHEVQIRIPPTVRMHHGQLLQSDNKPAAHVDLSVARGGDTADNWHVTFEAGDRWSPGGGKEFTVGHWQADAQGRYDAPIYAGMPYVLAVRNRKTDPENLLSALQVQLAPEVPKDDAVVAAPESAKETPRANWDDFKDLTIVFKAASGEDIPEVKCSYHASDLSLAEDAAHDIHGAHCFMARAAEKLLYRAWWNQSLSGTITVTGRDDARVEVALPVLPIRGNVMDAAGAPVADAGVFLLTASGPETWADRKTDQNGRFTFDLTPVDAKVVVSTARSRDNPDGEAVLNAKQRDANITLPPTGSFRVLLTPESWPRYLAPDSGSTGPYYQLENEESTEIWRAAHIRPGRYKLEIFSGPPLNERLFELPVEIKAGEAQTLDLRNDPRTKRTWQTLRVLFDGQPVSGAMVQVYAYDCWSVVDGSDLVKALGADEFATREKAEAQLTKAGLSVYSAALQGARAADPEIRLRARRIIDAIADDSRVDGVVRDLSDVYGRLRFCASVGRYYLAVARWPGRASGAAAFMCAPGQEPRINLRPARTLIIDSPNGPPTIALMDDDQLAARVIFGALGIRMSRAAGPLPESLLTGYVHALSDTQYQIPDLPVGYRYRIKVGDHCTELELRAGAAEEKLRIDAGGAEDGSKKEE